MLLQVPKTVQPKSKFEELFTIFKSYINRPTASFRLEDSGCSPGISKAHELSVTHIYRSSHWRNVLISITLFESSLYPKTTIITMAPTSAERDALTSRVLPQMVFSKGDETSKTAPPRPLPSSVNAEGRAKLRFEVQGNAM